MTEPEFERQQEQEAAAEAAAIGGQPSSEPPATDAEQDPALQPLQEAGQGEAEGFEEAERALVEHASHGDLHAARRVLEDAPSREEDERASEAGQADGERTNERPEE